MINFGRFMIHNTEVSILSTFMGKVAEITKVSGFVGMNHVRMYYKDHLIGVSFHINTTCNLLRLYSRSKRVPLRPEDEAIFYFESGDRMLFTSLSVAKEGDFRLCHCHLTDNQLLTFATDRLLRIEARCKSLDIETVIEFATNDQYQTKKEGQDLLLIVAEQMIGAKCLLMK